MYLMLLCLAKLLEFGRVQDIPSLFVGETVFVALYNHQPQRQSNSLKKKAYFTLLKTQTLHFWILLNCRLSNKITLKIRSETVLIFFSKMLFNTPMVSLGFEQK